MHITPLGDRALVVELGVEGDERTHYRVQAASRCLVSPPLPGVTEVVPGLATLTLFYDPPLLAEAGDTTQDPTSGLAEAIRSRLGSLPAQVEAAPGPIVEIPVCYGGEFGPDLQAIALHTGLAPDKVVRRHASATYLVSLIGFSPGFPYLLGLHESLAMPRRPTPRPAVLPGSVGIVNHQSCIYPMATPGGWNLLGRTPRRLFQPEANPPSLLQPGDRVQFRAITPAEFADWKEDR